MAHDGKTSEEGEQSRRSAHSSPQVPELLEAFFSQNPLPLTIIERSRNLDRNDEIVGQVLTRSVDNCLQDGLTPAPNTGSEDLNDEIRERFRDWS